ncbi:MAG: ADP-ribosylglycohydrolase family protein [Actinobacteria bacterium]|nr:ADP-ribosylglycohydrolase family protein [Actinomycetota bacterium]MBU4302083.1 ADP-ribosylglycohydrolase family protein [Actinomycetota bacterium]MBU4386511.1 ADP-ribosylglycohydrolase family protein [Actinomycetota bacterium]MBU4490411.1 ADP-ribosylglycohydrolase family protein [Actinomycetota bacterium]MCG2795186.1 ADP-ribosylglycohydrolase family protein [Actinomycetes bacterium]
MAEKLLMDRFKGALIGCAVGDALGAPVEGLPPEEIALEYGRVTTYSDGRFGAGRVTSNTQMAVALAQSILEMGRGDREHVGRVFGRWIKASDDGIKEARGVGRACATASRRLSEGTSPDESGVPSAGCGAATRAAPVGLRYYHEPDSLRRTASEQARLTHTDPAAAAGAVAVALAVSLGVRDEGAVDRTSFVEEIAGFVRNINPVLSGKIACLSDFLGASPEDGFDFFGNGGHVMEAVPGALFAFIRSPYDFEESVVIAASAGGDSSSLGAIAGAVSGAFNGLDAIPGRLKDPLEGRDYIESVAFRIYTLTPASGHKKR